MNELRRLLETHAALQLGIAPIEDVNYDANRIFAGMDPEEAKKIKRKFRKVWRALAKKTKPPRRSTTAPSAKYLIRGEAPTKSQRIARKLLVRHHVEAASARLVGGTARL